MAMKKWVTADTDKALAVSLSEECDIDPFTALIACARGYNDAASLEEFLSDEPLLCDYRELADIEKAAGIINTSIAAGELIAVYGDYDCDGITATALLTDYLRKRNARVIYYIPDRFSEGYGMHKESVEALHAKGVDLIITVDNGIAANEEIACANALGMKVVVTDHHIPQGELPEAQAVVDPHREDCPSSFKEICGVSVAFKLVCALEQKPAEELLPLYADLVGIGTVGDIMPLTGENRSIVKMALRVLRKSLHLRKGVSALLQISGTSRDAVTAGRIAFGIVPRINAAGRMGDASRAVELLLTDDIKVALTVAGQLDDDNAARQEKEKQIFAHAIKDIEENGYNFDRVIVTAGQNWHHGIVGIVAGKISEYYGKPAIVLSIDDDTASGSGRSFKGFSLFEAICSVAHLTQRFGGHSLAAGVTLSTNSIELFREKINEYAERQESAVPVLNLDCHLKPAALCVEMAQSVRDLEPFGMGNPQPVFGIFEVKLERVTSLSSGKHLRLLFSKDNSSFQALMFGVGPERFPFEVEDSLDLAVTLDTNLYNGEENLSVQIKGIRKTGFNDDEYFKAANLYDDLHKGKAGDYSLIAPTRDEVGAVYRRLIKGRISNEKLKQVLYPALGHFKTQTAVDALCELGLADKAVNNNIITVGALQGAPKTDLSRSQILRRAGEKPC